MKKNHLCNEDLSPIWKLIIIIEIPQDDEYLIRLRFINMIKDIIMTENLHNEETHPSSTYMMKIHHFKNNSSLWWDSSLLCKSIFLMKNYHYNEKYYQNEYS